MTMTKLKNIFLACLEFKRFDRAQIKVVCLNVHEPFEIVSRDLK